MKKCIFLVRKHSFLCNNPFCGWTHIPLGEHFFLWEKLTLLLGKCTISLWGDIFLWGKYAFFFAKVSASEANSPSCAGIVFVMLERHPPMHERTIPVRETFFQCENVSFWNNTTFCRGDPSYFRGHAPSCGEKAPSYVGTHIFLGGAGRGGKPTFLWKNTIHEWEILLPVGETHLPVWEPFFLSGKINFLWGNAPSCMGMCGNSYSNWGTQLPLGEQYSIW